MQLAELGKFLVGAPLYQPKRLGSGERRPLPGRNPTEFSVPKEVERNCTNCRTTTNWRWNGIPGSAERFGTGLTEISYVCKNCSRQSFTVWIDVWQEDDRLLIEKVGQSPKLEITLPPDFEKALGKSKGLYTKGMASRHAGYGIGALGYFRRVIDDTIGDMLGVLEAAMVETGAGTDAIETVRRAKAGKVFDEKVKLAAEAIPAHLKPGGMNPFADLYGLYSIGLHGLSDEECCAIVDSMDDAMKYVFTELKGRAAGAARYKEAATRIQQTLANLRTRKEGGASI